MLPHQTLLIATFNFSNKRKTANIIILHENHRIIKNKKISHTLNKYFTDFTKTLKLKTIIPALKKEPLKYLLKCFNYQSINKIPNHFDGKEKIAFR